MDVKIKMSSFISVYCVIYKQNFWVIHCLGVYNLCKITQILPNSFGITKFFQDFIFIKMLLTKSTMVGQSNNCHEEFSFHVGVREMIAIILLHHTFNDNNYQILQLNS